MSKLTEQAVAAKAAATRLMIADNETRNRALEAMAAALQSRSREWLEANRADMMNAEAAGLPAPMMDRLRLTEDRIRGITAGVSKVRELPDPVGRTLSTKVMPNGLEITKISVPLGVVAIIYEARPNVTVDAAALCLKSGNVCILRGGKEAILSNRAAVNIMQDALEEAGLPRSCISLVQDTDRSSATELMHMNDYVDVLIPRGGAGLIRSVTTNATVPVIRTGEGVCHVYVDAAADLAKAVSILENTKCQRPSVCNAAECVVIHKDVVHNFISAMVESLSPYRVELRCDEISLPIVKEALQGSSSIDSSMNSAVVSHKSLGSSSTESSSSDAAISKPYKTCTAIPAAPEDWDAEYNDLILAVKVVEGFEEAVTFISEHTTNHSECIVTEDMDKAAEFLNRIDAAAVYVNASTRFTDGGEFGMGAEIGISTQKLHARGPMGLEEMTSYKYLIKGNGQVR
ncbi:MAG: glutamate-5-semialdehyde dehydrogenase [Lachnospiraceae bacterium]|nr:glutamate-5-semialdehyde dehydrogenase [Lachnospiraceae bacterium]